MDTLRPAAKSVAPSVASAAAPLNPHFERIGGEDAIARLVERFHHHMSTLPQAAGIRAMHPADLGPVKRVLINYLVEWTGGPQRYSAERGHPRLRKKHLAFPIGPAERDAWMDCMRTALQETVTDAALRQQLEQAFFKTADFIRNDQGNHHEHHHS
ncbi:MAG: group II truncated hemoglobin [Gammaproteobacteria bacterium]|jgi:hemoglobin|nr:group II truncated hemoglobin [Gammaproteobacteria bacterium]MBU0769949.1 group II truncated hemoglobin [Gammaproteobacteria bacterium]MBU0856246.1 group II truncated hemoglobin [Gammaproteobacteria bacterium]MBU1847801.1 group II truncated hemoglobin [Gammaproteobacteria bacterium]